MTTGGSAPATDAAEPVSPAGATRWARVLPATVARMLLLLPVGLLVWVVLPALIGWQPTDVMTGSMEPRIVAGDVVVARPVEPGSWQVGQILLVEDPDHVGRLRLHRLDSVTDTGQLILKGDANADPDSTPVDPSAVRGVAVLRVPWVGAPVVWFAENRWFAVGLAGIMIAALGWLATLDRRRADHREPPARPPGGAPRGGGRVRQSALRPTVPRPSSYEPPDYRRRETRTSFAGRLAAVVVVGAAATITVGAQAAWSATTAGPADSWASATSFTCDSAVLARSPGQYFRLNDSGPPTAANSSGSGGNGTYRTGALGVGVTYGVAGPCSGGSGAVTLDGSNGWVSTATQVTNPTTYSTGIWFRTTTTSGGFLTGLVAAQTGGGSQMDRITWMDTSGRLVFGTYPGAVRTLTTQGQYNDGRWHQVIVTQSAAGKRIYVDGVLDGSDGETGAENFAGYWRIGYGAFSGNWGSGTGNYFAGSVAGAAFYGTALTASDAAAEYAAATPPGGCASAVRSASPFAYYHLDEGGPTLALDSSGNARSATYQGGITYSVPAACSGQTGITLDGSSGYVSTSTAVTNPTTFSLSLWFRTTTTRGGLLIGFGNTPVGTPTDYDRMVYLNNAGRVVFGTFSGVFNTLTSSAYYNDGAWHQVVASQSSAGMRLWVDGAQVGSNIVTGSQNFTGYWRVGAGNFDYWPDQPTSRFLAGSVADAAVYGTALTPAQVTQMYAATTIPATCAAAVTAAAPWAYYRLNQTTGASVAADSSGNGRAGTYQTPSMFTFGASGPCQRDGSTGVTLSGATPFVSAPVALTNPTAYSISAWVRTTSTSGGRVAGFASTTTGASTNYDRHLFVTATGQVVFGVNASSGLTELKTARAYNDGQWHLLVATQNASGTALWIDGTRVATSTAISAENRTGYWRVGWDNLANWPSAPPSSVLAGSLVDVAFYSAALSADQIAAISASRAGP